MLADPVMMFAEGGPFMPVVVGLGLLGGALAVLVALVVGGLKLRAPASLGWLGLTAAAAVGLLGTYLGVSMAYEAVLHASPEMKQTMLAHGISIAMYVQTGWMMVVGPALLLVACVSSLPALLAPGPDAKVSFESLGGAMLGAAGATLMSGVLVFGRLGMNGAFEAGPVTFLLPPIAVLAMFAMFLASLRNSAESEHMGRLAGTRAMMGLAAFLGIGLMGEFFTLQGIMLAFMAVASAAASDKERMLLVGIEIAGYARWIGWSVALIPALTAWGAAAPLVGDLDWRQGLGAVVALGQAAVILGAVATGTWLTYGIFESF